MFKQTTVFILALVVSAATPAVAKDAYFDIPVRDLKLIEGQLPKPPDQVNSFYPRSYYERDQMMQPYAVFEGPGEAYFTGVGAFGEIWPQSTPSLNIHIRARKVKRSKAAW